MKSKKTPDVVKHSGVLFHIYQTNQKTFMAYYNFAGERKTIHRKTMQLLDFAMRETASRLTGSHLGQTHMSALEWQEYSTAKVILEPFNNISLIDAAKYYEKTFSSTVAQITLLFAVDGFKEDKQKKGVSSEYTKYIRQRLQWLCTDFGSESVASITYEQLSKWINAHAKSGKGFNNLRALLVTFWNWCQNEGYFPQDKQIPPLRLERRKENSEEITVISPKQLKWLLSVVTDDARDWVMLGAFFGIRAAEIERLEGKNIDLTHKTIEVAADKAKTGQRRLMSIPDSLIDFLEPIAKREKIVGYLPQRVIRKAIKEAVKPLFKAWPKNVLRHSWISYKLAETGNIDQVATDAGTSREKIFKNYRALRTIDGLPVTKELAEKWFKAGL